MTRPPIPLRRPCQTACGASTVETCTNHDTPGAPWCTDCVTTALRERAEAGEAIPIIGINVKLPPKKKRTTA